jgi:hypothetical protein
MKRLGLGAMLAVALATGPDAAPPSPSDNAFSAATDAWDRGDYIKALNGYIAVLSATDGDRFLEPIALQTGELYQSIELTADGRNPQFSPDGRFVAYETGLEVSRRTIIVRNDAGRTRVAELPGVSATFSPTSATVAYLRIADTPELRSAASAVDAAPLAGQNRNQLVQALAWQVLRNPTIVVCDLDSGAELELAAPNLFKTGLAYAADGRSVYFLGARESDETRNDLYAMMPGGDARVVGNADGFKSVPVVDGSGRTLVYVKVQTNIFRRPGQQGGGGAAGTAPPPSFGVINLSSNETKVIEGVSPTLSRDGSTLAYIVRAGSDNSLMVGRPTEAATPIKRATTRLENPALSADGWQIAYQATLREDSEIFVANRDGSHETRLTRDVQHDVLPMFVDAGHLIGVIGEPRHRRSFLYDLESGTRQRLFHNNTVRTIAPEYQWIASRDGRALLVGAERDGNTVSPERGVYLMDLTRRVTKADVLKRLRASLAAETSLRSRANAAFQPIAASVRQVVDQVSPARIFQYEKALFDFDSKHISRPGNQRASEYLFNIYASFGYEPELQWFEARGALNGRTANVVATLRGTSHPELVYVVSSHYDSVVAGPGADDDTSGTAALLEAARVLAMHPQPATIVFASFTGEEAGLLGSREFVRRAVAGKLQVVGALNNDMIGWTNDDHLDNTIRYSNPGIRDLQHGAAMLFTRLVTYDALYFKGTDAASYYDAYGDIVGGIGSYPVLSSPHYHQSHDLLEFENHQLIAETAKTTVATLIAMASSPSRVTDLNVERAGTGVRVWWTPSPEKDVTSYVVEYSQGAQGARGAQGAQGAQGAAGARRMSVSTSSALLPAVPSGTVISVKAVNARRLEGWDWARAAAPD